MALTTLAQFAAARKQRIKFVKPAHSTTAAYWNSSFSQAGDPPAGTLAGTSTTTGVVPTDATTGFPTIPDFGGSENGYLIEVDFNNSTATRIAIYDMLWKGGAYNFNANTSGNTPASYASRVPGGDYTDCEIWYEQVTGSTGNPNVVVNYNDQDGNASSTPITAIGTAATVGQMKQLPLAAGDTGVQGITGVTATVATAGTFNLLVMRPLWRGRVIMADWGDVHGLDETVFVQVYQDSALYVMRCPDAGGATGVGAIDLELTLAVG